MPILFNGAAHLQLQWRRSIIAPCAFIARSGQPFYFSFGSDRETCVTKTGRCMAAWLSLRGPGGFTDDQHFECRARPWSGAPGPYDGRDAGAVGRTGSTRRGDVAA